MVRWTSMHGQRLPSTDKAVSVVRQFKKTLIYFLWSYILMEPQRQSLIDRESVGSRTVEQMSAFALIVNHNAAIPLIYLLPLNVSLLWLNWFLWKCFAERLWTRDLILRQNGRIFRRRSAKWGNSGGKPSGSKPTRQYYTRFHCFRRFCLYRLPIESSVFVDKGTVIEEYRSLLLFGLTTRFLSLSFCRAFRYNLSKAHKPNTLLAPNTGSVCEKRHSHRMAQDVRQVLKLSSYFGKGDC